MSHVICIKLHFFQLCICNLELLHDAIVLLLQSSNSFTRRILFTQVALESHVFACESQNFFLKFTCAMKNDNNREKK